MKIKFLKYHGAGNDFILIDNRFQKYSLKNYQIKFLCHRKYGIGSDGLIFLNHSDDFDFEMIYHNSDGNQSSMCGNGGRCIVGFAKHLNIIDSKAKFLAIDGIHEARIHKSSRISLSMSNINSIKNNNKFVFIDSGSPHHIIQVNDIDKIDVFKMGLKVRSLKKYQPKGVNVNFIEKVSSNIFKIRTYERGVENETLACGTGAVASAIAMHYNGETKQNKILIKTLGGDLGIKFEYDSNKSSYHRIFLEGDINLVYEGDIELL